MKWLCIHMGLVYYATELFLVIRRHNYLCYAQFSSVYRSQYLLIEWWSWLRDYWRLMGWNSQDWGLGMSWGWRQDSVSMAMTSLRRPHPLKLALLGASVRYNMVILINYLLTKSLKDWTHRILTKNNHIITATISGHSPSGAFHPLEIQGTVDAEV